MWEKLKDRTALLSLQIHVPRDELPAIVYPDHLRVADLADACSSMAITSSPR